MLRYNRWIGWFWRKITKMLLNSCPQLSLSLSHIRGLTIIAWNFVYDIIVSISFNPIFMYFNKTSEVIESSISNHATWLVKCGCYWFRNILNVRNYQNFFCLSVFWFLITMIKRMNGRFLKKKSFFNSFDKFIENERKWVPVVK